MKKITEAKKKELLKPPPNKLCISLAYDIDILVTMEQGLKILEALEDAEMYEHKYGEDPKISSIGKDQFSFKIFSQEEYINIKMANLLNVTVEELTNADD